MSARERHHLLVPVDRRRAVDLHTIRGQTQRGRQTMTDCFCVLRALVNGELAIVSFGDRANQFDRILMLRRMGK